MNKEKRLLAGAAKRDITPPEELLPMPFIGPVCMKRVADRISVRALCIESGDNTVLHVNFDMGEVPYVTETLDFVKQCSGLASENIFLTATHTHGVPFIGWPFVPADEKTEAVYRKWYALIQSQLSEAVREAMESRRPAKMGYGEGKSYVNVNRDEIIDGKYTYGNNYERPSDKTVRLIRFDDEAGGQIALIVNYAVHGVVVNGCMIGDGLWLSGDLPGRAETQLEEKLGCVVLWTPAASGDQNPRVCTNFGYVEGDNLRTKSLGESGYMILDSLAGEHVRNILAANETLVCDTDEASLAVAERTVLIPTKEAARAIAPALPFTLKLLRIGDIMIEGVSAEVVTTVGSALCALSDAKHTLMMTHMQGSSMYIPDNWEYEEGAQEVDESFVERGLAEPAFAEAFQVMLAEIKQE